MLSDRKRSRGPQQCGLLSFEQSSKRVRIFDTGRSNQVVASFLGMHLPLQGRNQMMHPLIRELDHQMTPIGELVLRCRRSPHVTGELVYEVKLDHEMLMSSSVNDSERALAQIAIDCRGTEPCDVLIGGLGLGYTAVAALDYPHVRRVDVVELLAPVIAWQRNRLVPASGRLVDDARCTFIEGDFFELVSRPSGTIRTYDIVLVDIDHSPSSLLHPRHQAFYTESRLAGLANHLRPGGVFGLWSAHEPPADFLDLMAGVFHFVRLHEIKFFNPHIGESDGNWIVIAHRQEPAQP
jgi:spermidine synthase